MSTEPSIRVEAQSQDERQAVLFVAAYCGLQIRLSVQDDTVLQLVASDGQIFRTYTSICRHLASISSKNKQLLGATALERATVQEWVSFRNTSISGLSEQELLKVNDRLQRKVYLAGSAVTLADLILFTSLHRALVNIPRAQITEKYPNLFRWFDFLQHTVDISNQYPKLEIRKPKFQKAPAAQVPAAKAEKPKADDAKSGKASKASTAGPVSNGAAKASSQPATSAAQPAAKADLKAAGTAHSKAAGKAAAPADLQEAPKKDAAAGKKAKAERSKAEKAPANAQKDAGEPTVDLLDIRVGQVVKVSQHPNADSLYVEEIDLGEDKPRQIVSGLVKFVAEKDMQDRRVVVVTNLKPAKMRDVMSYGMVLCASNDAHDQVEPILPPAGVPLGEKVTFEGYNGEAEAQLNPKKKIFEKIAPDLKTNADGMACYRDVQFMTSKGPVLSNIKHAAVK